MTDVDEDFIDFVKKLVVIKPSARMTVQQAAVHPFITKRGELPPVDISVVDSNGEEKSYGCL